MLHDILASTVAVFGSKYFSVRLFWMKCNFIFHNKRSQTCVCCGLFPPSPCAASMASIGIWIMKENLQRGFSNLLCFPETSLQFSLFRTLEICCKSNTEDSFADLSTSTVPIQPQSIDQSRARAYMCMYMSACVFACVRACARAWVRGCACVLAQSCN